MFMLELQTPVEFVRGVRVVVNHHGVVGGVGGRAVPR